MTQPVPWTETVTLNPEDNPVAIYLRHRTDGTMEWCLRIHPQFAADREAVKAAFLEVNQNCIRWLYGDFTPPHPATGNP